LAVLVWLPFSGYTPLFSGMVGLALTVVLIFAAATTTRFGGNALRVIFWVLIGFAASAFFKYGIGAIMTLALVMAVALWFLKG
jgi:hypothetical protein